VIEKKQNSKKFYNKFTNMSIFLGTMFPRKKAFFPVVLLNMVSREVKPVEGLKVLLKLSARTAKSKRK